MSPGDGGGSSALPGRREGDFFDRTHDLPEEGIHPHVAGGIGTKVEPHVVGREGQVRRDLDGIFTPGALPSFLEPPTPGAAWLVPLSALGFRHGKVEIAVPMRVAGATGKKKVAVRNEASLGRRRAKLHDR